MPDFFDTIWQKKRTVLMSKCPIRMRRLKFLSLPYRLCLIHSEKKSTACGKILRSCCILKGGSAELRTAFAYHYAGLFFCENPKRPENKGDFLADPCLRCSECYKVAARMHPDFIVFDSREGNIDVDSMRDLKKISTEAPRYARKRLVLLLETQKLSAVSGNAILKLLEEPSPHNHYVFTMSQREMVLPTLLSRVRHDFAMERFYSGIDRNGTGMGRHSY